VPHVDLSELQFDAVVAVAAMIRPAARTHPGANATRLRALHCDRVWPPIPSHRADTDRRSTCNYCGRTADDGVLLAAISTGERADARRARRRSTAGRGHPPPFYGLVFGDLFARHLEHDSVADLDGVVCEPFVEPAE
jgi:hypothetical protein